MTNEELNGVPAGWAGFNDYENEKLNWLPAGLAGFNDYENENRI